MADGQGEAWYKEPLKTKRKRGSDKWINQGSEKTKRKYDLGRFKETAGEKVAAVGHSFHRCENGDGVGTIELTQVKLKIMRRAQDPPNLELENQPRYSFVSFDLQSCDLKL